MVTRRTFIKGCIAAAGIGAIGYGLKELGISNRRATDAEKLVYGQLKDSGVLDRQPYDGEDPFIGPPSDFMVSEFTNNLGPRRLPFVRSLSNKELNLDVFYVTDSDENNRFYGTRNSSRVVDHIERGIETVFDYRLHVRTTHHASPVIRADTPRNLEELSALFDRIREKAGKDSAMLIHSDIKLPFKCSPGITDVVRTASFVTVPPRMTCTDGVYSDKHLAAISIHEILHTAGMPHNATPFDTMYPAYGPMEGTNSLLAAGLTSAIADSLMTINFSSPTGAEYDMTPQVTTDSEQANIVAHQVLETLRWAGLEDTFGITRSSEKGQSTLKTTSDVSWKNEEDELTSVLIEPENGRSPILKVKPVGRRLDVSFPSSSNGYTPLELKPLPVRQYNF